MRPIERGKSPNSYHEYQDARGDLINRLGEYCSYCEMHLDSALAVEHILPKNKCPEMEREWTNFLLACPNCNSTKGDKLIGRNECYWPDLDNTVRAFEYQIGGQISPHPGLTAVEKSKAQKTIELTGLNYNPGNAVTAADRRWINRKEAWDIAADSLDNLHSNDTPYMRRQIVETAKALGYWSIWMTVFYADKDILKRLIEAFPGTCDDCFDANFDLCQRPGGQL